MVRAEIWSACIRMPIVAPYSNEANALANELRQLADTEYDKAHERNDEVSRVAWSLSGDRLPSSR